MDKIVLKAYAKVNLALDVIRRRENGYHDLKMIMQTVDLYDVITIEKISEGIEISGSVPELKYDESNLIYKAAKMMIDEYNIKEGVRIYLEKNIPMAAGMAGGSTDGAAVYNGMNELFELGRSKEELCSLGVKIGADVPYCILGGTYLAEGIGEILTPLPSVPDCTLLIAKPNFDVSTKYVYENLHANELKHHPDVDAVIEEIKKGSLEGICGYMENVMETVTQKEYPRIGEIKKLMTDCGALKSMMSGSGPTVFGIFDQRQKAENCAGLLRAEGKEKQIFVSSFINRENF